MLGDVWKELHMQIARELRRQVVAELNQLGPYMCVNLLHPLVKTLDFEDCEVNWPESESGHNLYRPAQLLAPSLSRDQARSLPSVLDGVFPILSVKAGDLDSIKINPLNAAEIHIDLVGVGSWDVKRLDPASGAKMMLCHTSVESIGCERVPVCQKSKSVAWDNPMKVALF
jgi:hypothetical protein